MKSGALFAGYGGLDLATERVFGATTAWVSEFDAAPSRILASRFPDAPNLGDVTKVDWSAVEPVDIITGGSPCQDLSHAGKRAGMKAGTRSGLWASMCDAIETIRPRFVVWENVRGALSAEATAGDVEPCPICVGDGSGVALRALGRVLGDLAELGYDAAWCGLRAADVGAPHGRFRVFVLAWPADPAGNTGRLGDGADVPAGRGTDGRPSDAGASDPLVWGSPEWRDLTLLPSPRTSDTNGPGAHGQGGLDLRTAVGLLPTPRATDGTKGGPNQRGSSGDLMLPSAVAQLNGGDRANPTEAGPGEVLPGLRSAGSPETCGCTAWGATYGPAIHRWETVLGRPAPRPAEPTGKGGAHRLSARAVEWMMGLPDGWVTDVGLSRNEQLKALGNGVVPQQAEAALGHMLTVRSLEAVTS